MNKTKRISILSIIAFMIVSCSNFEGEQEIPAYIKIEGFDLVENPDLNIPQDNGFLSNEIKDVWVYVDNAFIGAFPLPCSVPVLQEGRHKVDIRPGVLYNGMQGTREAYPFYTTIIDSLDLVPGKEVNFTKREVMYDNNKCQFPNLYELFESPYTGFELADVTDGNAEKMNIISNDSVLYGNACGAIYFSSEGKNKYISIDSVYCTNHNGTVLELDYHSNIPFEVGIYGKNSSSSSYKYISAMRVTPNAEKGWQKMYILLNKVWSNLGYPNYYRFYFEAVNPDSKANTFIHLDNIKIVHYPNQY